MWSKFSFTRRPRSLFIWASGFVIVCLLSFVVLLRPMASETMPYPNAKSVTFGCGGNSFRLQRMWAMASFVHCFSTKDKISQVQNWYRAQGWDSPGDRLIYPGWQLGQIYFEKGKEFQTEVKPDGTIL